MRRCSRIAPRLQLALGLKMSRMDVDLLGANSLRLRQRGEGCPSSLSLSESRSRWDRRRLAALRGSLGPDGVLAGLMKVR